MTRYGTKASLRRWKQWVSLLIAILATATPVYAQDDEYLRDPARLRRDVIDSFIFRARDVFYAPGSSQRVDFATHPLAQKDATQLDLVIKSEFESLLQQYAKRRLALSLYFGQTLPEHLDISLDITDEIHGARVLQVNGATHLQISHSLLAADYYGSLAEVGPNLVQISEALTATDSVTPPLKPATEAEAIAAIDAIRAEANKRSPLPRSAEDPLVKAANAARIASIYALISSSDTLLGPMDTVFTRFGNDLAWVDAARSSKHVNSRFLGTLLFALAHEMGHAALGTVQLPPEKSDAWKSEAELNADRFATFFLSDVYMELGVRRVSMSVQWDLLRGTVRDRGPSLFFFDPDYAEDCLGYGIFFDKAYELTYASAGAMDWYPPAARRRLAADEVYTYAYAYLSDSIRDAVEKNDWRNRLSTMFVNSLESGLLSHLGK